MITCAIFQGPPSPPFPSLAHAKERNFYTNDLCPKLTSPVRSVPPFENTISLINCPVRHEASRSLFRFCPSWISPNSPFFILLFLFFFPPLTPSSSLVLHSRVGGPLTCPSVSISCRSLRPCLLPFIILSHSRLSTTSESGRSFLPTPSLPIILFLPCVRSSFSFVPSPLSCFLRLYVFGFRFMISIFCNGYYFLHPCIIFVFVFLLSVWR